MSNVPGDLQQAYDDETLSPLLIKLEAAFQGDPVQFIQTNAQQTVNSILASLNPWARSATIQVQGAAIRYTVDGTTPTAAVGHRADPGAIITLSGLATLRGFQWISEAAVNNTLAITVWS